MSVWWDDNAQKYRTSLVYKIFYVWGWPALRWIMYNCMKPETAHVFALHFGIPFVGRLDRVWSAIAAAPLCALILLLRLLAFLPGCSWEPTPGSPTAQDIRYIGAGKEEPKNDG